jgi:hypothetical protein
MKFSEHFDSSEFEHAGAAIPEDCYPVFTALCTEILEPVRLFVGGPLTITSGYRTAAENAATHGSKTSEHLATDEYCAADFTFLNVFGKLVSVRATFDWMRNNPALPFHQVILEHGANGSSIIHVSYNKTKIGIRKALEGATHNASPYSTWEVATFEPPSASPAGQENA